MFVHAVNSHEVVGALIYALRASAFPYAAPMEHPHCAETDCFAAVDISILRDVRPIPCLRGMSLPSS